MSEPSIMFVAGEVSGDARCASLITAMQGIRQARGKAPIQCFGAGGSKMREAGVELAFDMTQHAVIGHLEAIKGYFRFKKLFNELLAIACQRKPSAVVLVDFSGFNLRFARAIKARVSRDWNPKVIYFVSPQLWASRPGRARHMESCVDLLLSIIPFEKQWYAEHAPKLRVEFVGHPLMDEYGTVSFASQNPGAPAIVLLPGSRKGEVSAHLPVMLEALQRIRKQFPAHARLHLPNEPLRSLAEAILPANSDIEIRTGDLRTSLAGALLAITKSGTVSLECALMRVPSVVIYITSPILFYIGRRVVNVKHLAMPNLLSAEPVYPELIQTAATPDAIAHHGLKFLTDADARLRVHGQLDHIVQSLGQPGASRRAAEAVLGELGLGEGVLH